jgi:hypothetical protein
VNKNNIDTKTTEEGTIRRKENYNSSSSSPFPENSPLHKAVIEGIVGWEEQMQHYYHSLDPLHLGGLLECCKLT